MWAQLSVRTTTENGRAGIVIEETIPVGSFVCGYKLDVPYWNCEHGAHVDYTGEGPYTLLALPSVIPEVKDNLTDV